jgi:hypothetical protein
MWYLPASASKASFLTPEEKQLARQRVEQDSSSSTDEAFDLRDSLKIFRYPFVYIVLAIEICVGIPLQAGLFFPQIIGRFGYSAVKTNLYTVAPNVSGSAVLLILCFASDYSQKRFPFIAAGFLLTFIGFMIYAAIDIDTQTRIGYFSCFVMTWGGSAPSVLLDVWYCNNIAHPGRRLVLTGVAVPLANLMGVVSANIFRSQDAPKYTPALATIAACGATGVILTLSLGFWMAFDNRRRDRKQGVKIDVRDVSTALLRDGPTSPHFRWTL